MCWAIGHPSICAQDEMTIDMLRARLADAEKSVTELKRRVASMEKRLLPSPDASDDEDAISQQSIDRPWLIRMKHGNLSEEIMKSHKI
jgi:hypothetical protein